jgi:hypothetical protein
MIRLSGEQWERIRKHFPEEHIPDGRPGRKPVPTRRVLEAVLWILNTESRLDRVTLRAAPARARGGTPGGRPGHLRCLTTPHTPTRAPTFFFAHADRAVHGAKSTLPVLHEAAKATEIDPKHTRSGAKSGRNRPEYNAIVLLSCCCERPPRPQPQPSHSPASTSQPADGAPAHANCYICCG